MTCDIRSKKQFPEFEWNVNCRFAPEISILFGPSAAGKSITLQCLAGLLKPDEGRIQLGERVFFDSSRKIDLAPQVRNISFVFQNHALFPHMTVEENVCFGARDLAKSLQRDKARELLEKFKIDNKKGHYPSQISGGERQRVALARALIRRPAMLLLDEAFNSLDSLHRYELQEFLKSLQSELKIPFIFITHDLHEAIALADKIFIFDRGQVIQEGSVRDVQNAPHNELVARLFQGVNGRG